jgi:pyridoxine 4-dehydrogenase
MTTINASAAGTWQLGDLTVNRLGLGAMRLMPHVEDKPSDRGPAIEVLQRAIELGVNHIDTAAFYFSRFRSANELINTALNPYPEDLVITTKVGPGRDPQGNFLQATTRDELRAQVEENIRQLGVDRLDVVNLRMGITHDRATEPLSPRFEVLAELQQEGLIRHLGISNVRPQHLEEALKIAPVVCVQNQYGLSAFREDDAFIELCREKNVAYVPFFAIANEAAGVTKVAERHGVSEAQVKLAWTLHKGPNVLAIPGTGNPAHLEENVAAAGLRLDDEDMSLLDTIR